MMSFGSQDKVISKEPSTMVEVIDRARVFLVVKKRRVTIEIYSLGGFPRVKSGGI